MADNLEAQDVDRRVAASADSGAAGIVTARRRLMLGAAAVLPSVVTLPAGAQLAFQSMNCVVSDPTRRNEASGVDRFTEAPDQWLRKQVFCGRLSRNGHPMYCTTWDQPTVLAIANLQPVSSGLGYKALWGTTWSDGNISIRIGALCTLSPMQQSGPSLGCHTEDVDNISVVPDKYGLVYVDESGLSASLEPGPGMNPVRASCFASLAAQQGTRLG